MKKIKLFLAAAALMIGEGNLSAQTDVTSTYITNPSFEANGTTVAETQTSTAVSDWTYSYSKSDKTVVSVWDNSNNATGYGKEVTPADGSYYGQIRIRWENGINSGTLTQTSAEIPAGYYKLSIKYKAASSNNTSGTKITWTVKKGSTTLGTTNGTVQLSVTRDNTQTVFDDEHEWQTMEVEFDLTEAAAITYSLTYAANQNSDAIFDDVRLVDATINPTAITLNESSWSMLPTATKTLSVASYTPDGANHNKAITWESSNTSIATVSSSGVVTAVAAGTATITATTANGKSATCDITVNPAPIANGDYYILNVSKGKYLSTLKSGWGTQAGVADHGIPFYAELANGVYKLNSRTYNSDTQHFVGLNNEGDVYVDNAGAGLYITSLGGGKFSISFNENANYLTASAGDLTVSKSAADASNELAQWKLYTKAELEAALADATTASPLDATFYIADPDFSRNYWPAGRNTTSWSATASNKNLKGGNNDNMCAETYQNGGGTIYQTLTVPNGRYGVKCQGFYRQDSGSTPSYLYSNGELKQALSVFNANSEGTAASMNGASTSFSAGLYQSSELMVDVTDGSLTVGIEGQAGNWTCFDNFELNYYGQNLAEVATEIAMETATALTASKWYYFDIAVDGEYDLTLTTLADIVYTVDGAILVENQSSVTTNFAGTQAIALTVGRYYVKSSSAQSLTVAPHSYNYEIGSATLSAANGSYTQNRTFTVTYPDAATNDPGATAALVAGSKATVNGVQVALAAVADGFSLDLDELLPGAGYNISIPANVYGYAGESMNSAIDLTLYVPEVFDGTYFVRASDGKYISRGSSYNTRATVDEFGVPLAVATDAAGNTTFTYCDNLKKLFDAGSTNIYTDNVSNPNWNLQSVLGGFYIVNANDNGSKGQTIGIVDGHLQSNNGNEVWVFEPTNEHNTHMEALKDAQAATAATAAGISASDKSELATELAANYNATAIAITGVDGIKESYQKNATNSGDGIDYFTETVDDLIPGLYKLTVNGFYRWAWNADVEAAGGARSNVYLFAGDVKTQFASPFDYPANSAWVTGNDYQDAGGKYYPNNQTGAGKAYDAGNYLNELFVYVSGTSLTFGIHNPGRLEGNDGNNGRGTWLTYRDFTLTRYDQTEANMTIGDAKWGTFVAPFDVTIPSGVTAYKILSKTDNTLNLTAVETTIPANTPVVVYSESAVNETFKGKTIDGTPTVGLLTGVYTTKAAPNGSYILQNQDSKVGFYQVDTSKYEPNVPANRAYLTVCGGSIKAFFFGGETVIKNVFDGVAAGEIYDLNGIKVDKMQKGKAYIVNGTSVIVK